MIETLAAWIAFGAAHIKIAAVITGSAVGYVLTVMLERYFLPIVYAPEARRRQKGMTFLFCWLASGTGSALLWWAIEPGFPAGPRVAICYVLGVLAFPVYPIVARALTERFPLIGSAWAKADPDDGQDSGA